MIKLTDILLEMLEEKKADRCKRIADRKYDKPSAYKSGAIVRCRKGNIWKGIKEEITTNNKPVEDSFLTKTLNSLSKFIRGEELINFLKKIKTLATFDDYILKYEAGTEGANQFIVNILDKNNNNKVGKFVAFIYKDKDTGKYSLQIQKVEIYPEYKGKGIMRNFYREFNEWLKSNFNNFDKFTSDFIFLYNKDTGKYDGFSMWEDLVKKGLARRLGSDENYIPPATPPKDGMWYIKTGYALKEELDEKKETLRTWFKRKGAPGKTGGWVDCNTCREVDGKTKCKPCGRKEGEKRAKYPSCRPTVSACKQPGKGKKWGKTK
jgi:hypothetical protein